MPFRTRFQRVRVSPDLSGETLTQVHLAEMCNINNLIQRFLAGDPSAIRNGRYGDFTKLPESLHDACNRLANANSIWENLPDAVRASYGSPENLLHALEAEALKSQPVKPEASDVTSETPVSEPKKEFKQTELNV